MQKRCHASPAQGLSNRDLHSWDAAREHMSCLVERKIDDGEEEDQRSILSASWKDLEVRMVALRRQVSLRARVQGILTLFPWSLMGSHGGNHQDVNGGTQAGG